MEQLIYMLAGAALLLLAFYIGLQVLMLPKKLDEEVAAAVRRQRSWAARPSPAPAALRRLW